MPSARYFREQAQLLLGWALATSDPDHATQLTARAVELLSSSMEAEGARGVDLNQSILEFNESQLRPRPAQQQQQRQESESDDHE
jgi:hypothetical protein